MQQSELPAQAFGVARYPLFSKRVLFVEAPPTLVLLPIVSKSYISLQLSTKPQWEEQGEGKQAKLTFLISKLFYRVRHLPHDQWQRREGLLK